MFEEIDRAYHLKPAAKHIERAAQADGHATAVRQCLTADHHEQAAELLRREVARQIG